MSGTAQATGQWVEVDHGGLDGTLTPQGHRFKARIYYADTDFSGFVYHARHLEFLERGRSDFLRLLEISHVDLAARAEPLVWVVRHMDIRYFAPARIDDIILVETGLAAVAGARIVLPQVIRLGATTIVAATVEAALVTTDGKPRRLPRDWLPRLAPFAVHHEAAPLAQP